MIRKLLFAASECAPFFKTGGLGDVMGALPKELSENGHDVRVVFRILVRNWMRQQKNSWNMSQTSQSK
ncbi:MAG: glycogen/starch synthase [Alkalibacterium sp.]|nr:glycogen/starch synthase [Alkalibacterium sp.]